MLNVSRSKMQIVLVLKNNYLNAIQTSHTQSANNLYILIIRRSYKSNLGGQIKHDYLNIGVATDILNFPFFESVRRLFPAVNLVKLFVSVDSGFNEEQNSGRKQ